MNIKKGIERIALVIAIVAILPGFFGGAAFVFEVCKTETPEHKEWQKKVDGWYEANPDWNYGIAETYRPWEIVGLYYPSKEWREPKPIYKVPPTWQIVLGGIAAAPLSFFIVLFGIRGTRHLAIWIVAGFKDKGEERIEKHNQ